jgi:transcription antitermination factor NusG
VPLLKREPEIWPPHLFDTAPTGPAGADEPLARVAAGPVPAPRVDAGARPIEGSGAGNAAGVHWWVAYIRSRQEKGLARHLLQWEVPYYLPQREHRFRAGDRIRTSHLPLFTGYVFFRGDLEARLTALRSNLIVKLIDVPDEQQLEAELRSLWLLQTTGEPLVPHPYLGPGDEVEITDGALRGYRGVVLREKGKYRLVVSVTLLRQSVAVDIEREALAPSALRKVG